MKKKKGKYQSQTQRNPHLIAFFAAFGVLIVLGVSSFAFFKAGEHAAQSRLETEPQMILETISQPQETTVTVAYQLEPEIPETTVAIEESTEAAMATVAPTEHTQPATEATQPQVLTGTVLRSAGELNVRSGPGTNYSQVGRLKGGDAVTVYEQQTSNGKAWGNIGNGWVSMDYVVFGVDSSVAPDNNYAALTDKSAEYYGDWVSENSSYVMTIITSGKTANITVTHYISQTELTTWQMNGEYDEHSAIRYWNGIRKDYSNGSSSIRFSNGEGVINLNQSQLEWHEVMEQPSGVFKYFTKAGAHTPNPPYWENSNTAPGSTPSQDTTSQIAQIISGLIKTIPKRFDNTSIRPFLEGIAKTELGYTYKDTFRITSCSIDSYDSSSGKYLTSTWGKWNKSSFHMIADVQDTDGVLSLIKIRLFKVE